MPLITGFSPEMAQALRQFSLVEHREVDLRSPRVRVVSGRCARCGFETEPGWEGPADTLRAVTMTHELSWETGQRCGGQVEFVTEECGVQLGGLLQGTPRMLGISRSR